jgi:hypothetical protein
MAMIPGGKELIEIAHELRFNDNKKKKIQKTLDKITKMNNTSRNIIRLEGELSKDGAYESGRIQGRIETIKYMLEELGYNIIDFDF